MPCADPAELYLFVRFFVVTSHFYIFKVIVDNRDLHQIFIIEVFSHSKNKAGSYTLLQPSISFVKTLRSFA
jgi:hypothetical protein